MITKMAKKNVVVRWSLTSITVFTIWLVAASVIGAEVVSFKGTTKTASGDFVTLTGKLTKPQGDGPFPAVVLLHGCAGIDKCNDEWADKLASWGYVALEVDSLGPRGLSEICDDLTDQLHWTIRTQDAYDAKSYLSGVSFVDRNRIGLMGWSHGGITTLASVSRSNYARFAAGITTKLEPPKRGDLFRAAVAFYPGCIGQLDDTNAPLLILIGELDNWSPAAWCERRMPSGKTANEVILKIYPGAYHRFDCEGIDTVRLRVYRLLYNPVASADSMVQVKEFFAKHLK
jgi:dienelactone hydrolase